jgi:hypothetical protein
MGITRPMGSAISRRQALKNGLGAGAALALPPGLGACSSGGEARTTSSKGGASVGPVLPYPRVLNSYDGVLALTLTATPALVNIGDTLKIDLVNALPALPHEGHPADSPGPTSGRRRTSTPTACTRPPRRAPTTCSSSCHPASAPTSRSPCPRTTAAAFSGTTPTSTAGSASSSGGAWPGC